MPANPQAIAHYRNLREQANASIPSEAGPARAAAANPPVPKAWVNAGDMDLLVEQRPDGVFVTGKRLPDGSSTTFPAIPAEGVVGLPSTVNATTEGNEPTVAWSDMPKVEEPSTGELIGQDLQQGFIELMEGRIGDRAAEEVFRNGLNLFSEARDFLASGIPDETRDALGIQAEVTPYGDAFVGAVRDVVGREDGDNELESVSGSLTSALAQFLIPFGAISKGGQALGVVKAGGWLEASGQAAGYGMLTDIVAWDAHEGRFADLVQSVPWAANPITEWLATDEDGDALYERLKTSVEGLALGGITEAGLRGLVTAARLIKQGRVARGLLGEEGLATLKQHLADFAADETGTVRIPGGGGPDAGDVQPPATPEDVRSVGADSEVGLMTPDEVRGMFEAEPEATLQDVQLAPSTATDPVVAQENVRIKQMFEDHVAAPAEARDNQGRLAPYLRMTADLGDDVELPKGVPQSTNVGNAPASLAQVDEALDLARGEELTVETWGRSMAHVYGSPEVPVAPHRLINQLQNVDAWAADLERLTPSQLRNVEDGLADAAIMGGLYSSGKAAPEDTAGLLLWSFLSKGVDPFTQEAMFLDVSSRGVREGINAEMAPWIRLALDGNFTKDKVAEFVAWAKGVAPKGSGLAGAGTAHNLNAFGDFLQKMGETGPDGVSHLQTLHNMIADGTPSRDIRRWFHSNVQGVGIDNKVLSFTLLAAGRTDVVILDRVQIRNMFDDGRFAGINIYDGKKVKGQGSGALTGTTFAPVTTGARGLAIYEMIEEALLGKLGELSERLGREMTPGRFHWESWVLKSEQEVDHATLSALRQGIEARNRPSNGGPGTGVPAWANVYVRQGKHATYNYGVSYGVDMDGVRHYKYETSDGTEYVFSPSEWTDARDAFSNPKNGVIPADFKVSEYTDAPWIDAPSVNREKLDGIIRQHGTPLSGTGGDGANVSPGDAGTSRGRRGGAALAGGAGAAVLAGSAGQDALASTGEDGLQTYFDAEGNERVVGSDALFVLVPPRPGESDLGGAVDAPAGDPATEEFQVAGNVTNTLEEIYKKLGWIPPTIDESAGKVLGGTITDETFDALRSSLGSPSMDDIDVALGSFPYASLTETGQIDDFFAAVTDAFSQQIGDVTGAAPRAAIAGMRDEVTALQNQLADLTAGPLASADVKGMTQVQRDLLEIDLVRRIEDLEQRIARSGRAEQGVMTDDTVAWLANATGLTEDQLLNRATGEAYNAPQLRAARAIVEGSLDQVRSIHAETLLNPTTENLALLRRQAQITSALLLQFKGAVAEAGRALGSLRANAAMPPDMPAGAMPPNDLMRAVMLADYVETTGGEEVNKRFLAMMTEALKEPNSSLLADYTRRASGASTMDMLVEAWINSLLGSPTTHAVNFIGNSALTTSLLTERWLAPFIPTGNTTGPRRTFGSSAAYTFALMSSFREALQLAFRAGTSNSYSSKFTTATRGSALTIENIAQLRNRDTGNYLSDLFDRSVGTVLEDAGLLLPRGTLEQGGLTAYLADGLFEYYYRGPSRVLSSADEFFKVINYRAAVAEYAYMQATAEGLTGQAFKDRVDAIMASPDTLAPDIHLGAIEHSRYATLQMDSTPVMQSFAQLRSTVAGGKIVVPFLNVIANIIRVGAHRMPVAGLAMPDNIARLQTGNAADRQEVVSRQVMGGMLLMSGAMLAANGCITGRLTDNYEQREALATEGIQPYSFNMGCFGGEDGHFISYARTEPMSSFLAMSADVSQMLAYTDKEQDATMIAAAALSSVANYTMDQSFLQGVVTVLNAATPNSRDMEAGLDKAGRVGTEMAVGLLMGTFGPAGPGSPLMANLNRTFGDGDVRRDTRPDPMGNYLERQLESVLNRYRSRTLGLSDDVTILDWEFDALPVRYNWLGKPMPYDAFGPDVLSPFPQMQAEHDAAFLVDELGLDPERAATLDLTGMRVGPDNEIPLSKWGGYVDAVGISGEFIRLGLIPPSVPGRLLGVELTPTQQSLFAYLRGQGTYIRGDGGATYAVDPDGNTVRTVVGSSGLGASGLYPNLEPGEFYNMEEALNAVIASEWYALKSDYTDSNLGSGADTKKEVLSEIISLYTSGANVGGTARTALFNLFPDLASDVLERRHNVPPELLPPDMLDAILNSGVTP
jgi:hypothetical protein